MLIVNKDTTPLDWLAFEVEQQRQHIQELEATYERKYVFPKQQRTRLARRLKEDIVHQYGRLMGLEDALKLFHRD